METIGSNKTVVENVEGNVTLTISYKLDLEERIRVQQTVQQCNVLHVECYSIQDSTLEFLSTLRNIVDLRILFSNNLTLSGWAQLKKFRKLKLLDVSHCRTLSNEVVQIIGTLDSLEYLSMAGCQSITGRCIPTLFSLSKLKYIDLSWCTNIPLQLIEELVGQLKNLADINITGMHYDPSAINELINSCQECNTRCNDYIWM